MKRAMDIVISVLSLILLSPFMIYFAIAIKMGSKVLYCTNKSVSEDLERVLIC